MLNVKLNIGLAVSDNFTTGKAPTLKGLLRSLELNNITVLDYDVKPSSSEPTFTAECVTDIDEEELRAIFYDMSSFYMQDCVAVIIDGKGDLIGEYIDNNWLPFNIEYFVPVND